MFALKVKRRYFCFSSFLVKQSLKTWPNLAVLQVYLRHPLRQEVRFL
ncbi:hypothetical protein ECDEC3F_1511 [Escherichia coli DEC3F]|nr:hypothetical protein ECDEC3F_1511 [Escherichia coli DEC3F]